MEFKDFDIRKYRTLPVTEGYKEWADTYEKTVMDEMDLRLIAGIQNIVWTKISHALDLACGTGRIGAWLKARGVESVDGVDMTEEMLSKAREKSVYHLLVNADVYNTGLPHASYDLVIQSLADEHLPTLSPLYQEASRVLSQGGWFVMVGYHPFFLMQGLVTHFHSKEGEPVAIESHIHLFSDHVKAAQKADFNLVEMEEGLVDEAWIRIKPKWNKYRNRPVSFILVWQKK